MVAGCRCFACACDIWYASGAYVYVFEAFYGARHCYHKKLSSSKFEKANK